MFKELILALLLMQYASFSFAIEFNSKFPKNEEERILKESTETKSPFARFADEIDKYKRERRQTTCFPSITCDTITKYRTIDGTCNNLKCPYCGSSGIPFVRFLPSQYENGVSSPRGTGRSPALPRPRDVSAAIVKAIIPTKNEGYTLMLMQVGQILDHDFTLTAEPTDDRCCSDFKTATPTSTNCLPIDVTNDPFYKPKNVSCLPFVRSTASSCAPGPQREQTNVLTAYLDGSMIYGSTASVLTALREPNSYRMKFGTDRENTACPTTNSSYPCFIHLPVRKNNVTGNDEFFAGDQRVEEQPGLTSMHALFLRMHNDLGQVLRSRNPTTVSNEIIFQETRKIVSAVLQQITYNEFLPLVLGTQIMTDYGLTLKSNANVDPFFRGYNENVDASIFNVFATAAFRFGHTLIKNFFNLAGVQVDLSRSFNSHSRTITTGTFPSHFLRGIAIDPAEEADHILVSAVQNFLFARSPFTFGQDLYARNIMRGRDHGIASYRSYINTCIPGAVNSFADLRNYMPGTVVDVLTSLYASVDDIDLFPAAMAENNHPGALLGPTFTCILAEMFSRIKYGDRFWFEREQIFTANQLRSIRNTKLSTLLCLYTNAQEIQENVLRQVTTGNPLKSCTDILKVGVLNDITLYW